MMSGMMGLQYEETIEASRFRWCRYTSIIFVISDTWMKLKGI